MVPAPPGRAGHVPDLCCRRRAPGRRSAAVLSVRDVVGGEVVTLEDRASSLKLTLAGKDVTATLPHRLLYNMTTFATYLVYWAPGSSGEALDVSLRLASSARRPSATGRPPRRWRSARRCGTRAPGPSRRACRSSRARFFSTSTTAQRRSSPSGPRRPSGCCRRWTRSSTGTSRRKPPRRRWSQLHRQRADQHPLPAHAARFLRCHHREPVLFRRGRRRVGGAHLHAERHALGPRPAALPLLQPEKVLSLRSRCASTATTSIT